MEELDKKTLYEINELVKTKRHHYDFGTGPIGDSVFKLIREMEIGLLFLPASHIGNEDNPLSALYFSSNEDDGKLKFIGLNTNEFFDKQIFAVAHELYHHWEDSSGLVVCRNIGESDHLRERKANRFAAELLLPTEVLEKEIKEINDYDIEITSWKYPTVLRFIAQLHCDFKLPYKAIVRRLYEVSSINISLFETLLQEDVRNEKSKYYKIASNIDYDVFSLLNRKTQHSGADSNYINIIIENFEDETITLAELSKDLSMFNKTVEDYGYDDVADEEDLEEFNRLFSRIKPK
jgi:Zn-dependent peptidase ImmA (M78 family)